MPEVFEFKNDLKDWAEWFIIESMGMVDEKLLDVELFKDKLELTLTLNGLELPVMKTLRYIGNRFDEICEKEVKKRLEDRVDEKVKAVYDMLDKLKEQVKEKL